MALIEQEIHNSIFCVSESIKEKLEEVIPESNASEYVLVERDISMLVKIL